MDVEVLDVTEEEYRQLLLTIDPLASLAQEQNQFRQLLLEITTAASPDLSAVWQRTADDLLETPHGLLAPGYQTIAEEHVILVTCKDERTRWTC